MSATVHEIAPEAQAAEPHVSPEKPNEITISGTKKHGAILAALVTAAIGVTEVLARHVPREPQTPPAVHAIQQTQDKQTELLKALTALIIAQDQRITSLCEPNCPPKSLDHADAALRARQALRGW